MSIYVNPQAWVTKYKELGYNDDQLLAAGRKYGIDISTYLIPKIGTPEHEEYMTSRRAASPDDVYEGAEGFTDRMDRGLSAVGNTLGAGVTAIPGDFYKLGRFALIYPYAMVKESLNQMGVAEEGMNELYGRDMPGPLQSLQDKSDKMLNRAHELAPDQSGRITSLYFTAGLLDAIPGSEVNRLLNFSELGKAWDSVPLALKDYTGVRTSAKYLDSGITTGIEKASAVSATKRVNEITEALRIDKSADILRESLEETLYGEGRFPKGGFTEEVFNRASAGMNAIDDAARLSVLSEVAEKYFVDFQKYADDYIEQATKVDPLFNGKRDPRHLSDFPKITSDAEAEAALGKFDKLTEMAEENLTGYKKLKKELRTNIDSTRKRWLYSKWYAEKWLVGIGNTDTARAARAQLRRQRGLGDIQDTWVYQGTFDRAKGGELLDAKGRGPKHPDFGEPVRVADRGETILTGEPLHAVLGRVAGVSGRIAGKTADAVVTDFFDRLMPIQRELNDFQDRNEIASVASAAIGDLMKAKTELDDLGRTNKITAFEFNKKKKILDKQIEELRVLQSRQIPQTPEKIKTMQMAYDALRYEYGNDFPILLEEAGNIRKMAQRQIIDPMVEAGIMSEKTAAKILKSNSFWIPFEKSVDHVISVTTGVDMAPSLQKGKSKLGMKAISQGLDEYTKSPAGAFIRRMNNATKFLEEQALIGNVIELSDAANTKALQRGGSRDELLVYVGQERANIDKGIDDVADVFRQEQDFLQRKGALPGGSQPKNVLRWYTTDENGNSIVQYWGGNSDLVDAILDTDRASMQIVNNYLRKSGATTLARMARLGWTSNVAFMARNIIRDPQTMFAFSKYTSIPFWNAFSGFLEQARLGDAYLDYLRNGFSHATAASVDAPDEVISMMLAREGMSNPLHHSLRGVRDIWREELRMAKGPAGTVGHGIKAAGRGGMHFLTDWGAAFEGATRVGQLKHMRKLQKAGKSNRYLGALDDAAKAMWRDMKETKKLNLSLGRKEYAKQAHAVPDYLDTLNDVREAVVDFNRLGTLGQVYNSVEPFFNANLQDASVMARAMTERPIQSLTKMTSGILIPSVAFWLLNKDNENYHNQAEWKKDLYWFVKEKDNGEWFTVPKPFLPGIIFGSMVERFLNYAYDKGDKGQMTNAIQSLMDVSPAAYIPGAPGIAAQLSGGNVPQENKRQWLRALPQGAQQLVETSMNYSEFSDRPVLPETMEGGTGHEMYRPETNRVLVESARLLSEKLGIEQSPIKMEYMMEQLGGRVATAGLDAAEKIFYGDERPFKEEWYKEWFGFRGLSNAFMSGPGIGLGSSPVRSFYGTKRELESLEKEYRIKKERNDPDYAEFMVANQKKLQAAKQFRKYALSLGKIYDARESVLNSSLYTNKEKLEKRKRLDEAITKSAREYNQWYSIYVGEE